MSGTDTPCYTPAPVFAPRGLRELENLLAQSSPAAYLDVYKKWTRDSFDSERWQWIATKAFFVRLEQAEEEMTDDELARCVRDCIGEDVAMHASRASAELYRCAQIFGATCTVRYNALSTLPPASDSLQRDAMDYYKDYVRIEQDRFGTSNVLFPADYEADVVDFCESSVESQKSYKIFRKSLSETTRHYFPRSGEYASDFTIGMRKACAKRIQSAQTDLERAAINFGFAVELRQDLCGEMVSPIKNLKKLETTAIAFFERDKAALAGAKRPCQ